MIYKQRIIEVEIQKNLKSSGALLIKGPKSCGKTLTAMQFAKSRLQVDIDPKVKTFMDFNPEVLLDGQTPRLIDEWQEQPLLWNYIRHNVDKKQKPGQFILTGSANPVEITKTHSGAGRFTISVMRTMSWFELGFSSGTISLGALLKTDKIKPEIQKISINNIINRLIIGGWPTNINKSVESAKRINKAYIDLLAEVDLSKVSKISRDPNKIKALLKSLARNISTAANIETLTKDIKQYSESITRLTVSDYLDTLERLMIIENQRAWNTHIRSSAQLRKAPKRHFADVSLAISILGLNQESLLKNPEYLGFLFESLVIHDLRVYAQANAALVYHYKDSNDKEIDAIVQNDAGEWAAFEIKLGPSLVDTAAKILIEITRNISKRPSSLNIIVGTGISYKRPDGVNVISLSSLGV
jgi:predicted AAA+ superfamily ATPase